MPGSTVQLVPPWHTEAYDVASCTWYHPSSGQPMTLPLTVTAVAAAPVASAPTRMSSNRTPLVRLMTTYSPSGTSQDRPPWQTSTLPLPVTACTWYQPSSGQLIVPPETEGAANAAAPDRNRAVPHRVRFIVVLPVRR